MPHGPANFCSMVVKPYYTEKAPEDEDNQSHNKSYEKVDQNQDNQSNNDTEPTAKNKVQYCGQG
jgi:hypothetical protein